jgi:hypothetical protein
MLFKVFAHSKDVVEKEAKEAILKVQCDRGKVVISKFCDSYGAFVDKELPILMKGTIRMENALWPSDE